MRVFSGQGYISIYFCLMVTLFSSLFAKSLSIRESSARAGLAIMVAARSPAPNDKQAFCFGGALIAFALVTFGDLTALPTVQTVETEVQAAMAALYCYFTISVLKT